MPLKRNGTADANTPPQNKTLGFVVNPIAGMGGAVGLKGTDGKDILEKAVALGAKPVAPLRAVIFLSELQHLETPVHLVVGAGSMGEDEARSCGLEYEVLGERKSETFAGDTRKTAHLMINEHVSLLAFCGGDGTARDVLNAVNMRLPVLGVPTGVKMHSAVFAVNPQAAARASHRFLEGALPLREAEVMDIDEGAFRKGQVSSELHGYMLTPYEPDLIQGNKLASPITESELRNQAAIAVSIIEEMEQNTIYVIGPGTTTRTVVDLLDTKKTLLGVDLLFNKAIVGTDVNEKQILKAVQGKRAKIIVTPIGGQGFVFGRGNQQISSKVIRQIGLDNVIVIATESKLRSLRHLRVDTGDPELDAAIRKHRLKVIADYKVQRTVEVE